jgi:hypothetical protein
MAGQIIFFMLGLAFSVLYVTSLSLLLSNKPEFKEMSSTLSVNIVGYLAVMSWTMFYWLSNFS